MKADYRIIKRIAKGSIHKSAEVRGFDVFRHWHMDVELIFVEFGTLTIGLNEKNIDIGAGEVFVIASNVMHTFLNVTDHAVVKVVRVPDNSLVKHFEKSVLFLPTSELINIFNAMINADFGEYNELYVVSKFNEFSVCFLTNHSIKTIVYQEMPVEKSDITLEIQAFVEKSLQEKIALPDLAKHLGFSENYCSTIVKLKTGVNFLEYVNFVRLREAERFLRTTNMQIIDICFATGFSSLQSFNRNFKKFRGITPSEYRKRG